VGSQVGWANVFLFAHHSINHQYHIGGQPKHVAHPTWLKFKIGEGIACYHRIICSKKIIKETKQLCCLNL